MARVLHIEDDPNLRLLMQRVLTAAGHQVIEAETGLEGIRLAKSERPDLVLVDINIPDLDGYEVTLRLRGIPSLQSTPIVALTAEGDRATSLAAGADGFVEKPIDVRGFPALIERYLLGKSDRRDDEQSAILRMLSHRLVERLEDKVVALSRANQRLEESARLRQEFLRNLSHEFATPMTPVVGYLRLLINEELGPLTPLMRKCIESIDTSTRKLRSLIDTLLDVSHLEAGKLHLYSRDYDFREVMERALATTADGFKQAGIELAVEAPTEEMPGRGDPDKLRRALVHILDNAAKFTPRGAQVAVSARCEQDPMGRDVYRIDVADGGPGINEKDRQRILQPFFQVDGSRTRLHGGVGLGLAYARHVAEALGGSLKVASPPREMVAGRTLTGTCITLSVRAKASPEPAP
jgi:signal transduction histidine kinase